MDPKIAAMAWYSLLSDVSVTRWFDEIFSRPSHVPDNRTRDGRTCFFLAETGGRRSGAHKRGASGRRRPRQTAGEGGHGVAGIMPRWEDKPAAGAISPAL